MRARPRGRDELDVSTLKLLDLAKFMRRPQRLPDDVGDVYGLENAEPTSEVVQHFTRNLLLYSNFEQIEDVALVAVSLLQTQHEILQNARQERQSRREFQAAGMAEISRRNEGVANPINDLRSSFQKLRERNEELETKRAQLVELISAMVKRAMDVAAADAALNTQLRHQRVARLDLPELAEHLREVVDELIDSAETEWQSNQQRILNDWTQTSPADERQEVIEGLEAALAAGQESITALQQRLQTDRITDLIRSDLETQLLGLKEYCHDLDLQGRRSRVLKSMLVIDAEQLLELCNHAFIGVDLPQPKKAEMPNSPPLPPSPLAQSAQTQAAAEPQDVAADQEDRDQPKLLRVTSGLDRMVVNSDFDEDDDDADDDREAAMVDDDRGGDEDTDFAPPPRISATSDGGRRRAVASDLPSDEEDDDDDRTDNLVSMGPRTLPDEVDSREVRRATAFSRALREEDLDPELVVEPVVAHVREHRRSTLADREDEAQDQPLLEDQVVEAAEDDSREPVILRSGYEDTRVDSRREDLRESVRKTREALDAREKGLGELRDSLRRSKVSGRHAPLSSSTSQMAHFAEAHSDSSEAIGQEALIRALRIDLEDARNAREEAESEMLRLKTRASRQESELRRITEENQSLSAELNEEREQYAELVSRAEAELGAVEQTKKQLQSFGRKIEDLTEALELREDEVERLETELRERLEQLRGMSAQVEQLAERSAAQARGIEERDQVIEETTSDLDRRNSEVIDLREDVERYEERLTDLRHRYDNAIREVGEARNHAENLRMEVDRRERRIDHLENEVSARADENERISAALVARGEQLTETAEQLGRASEQLENARREIARLGDELDHTRDRAEQLREAYDDALETNERLTHDLREARHEIEHREEEVTRLYEVVESTSANLQDAQREAKRAAEEARRERDSLTAELERLAERVRNYERERELLRERISNEEEQRHQLLDALQRAQTERKHEQGALMEEIRELRRESSQRFTSMRDISNRMEELQTRLESGSGRRVQTERIGSENLRKSSRYESRLLELSDLMSQITHSSTPRERERLSKEMMLRLQTLVSEAGGALPPEFAKLSFALEQEMSTQGHSTPQIPRGLEPREELPPRRKPRMVREDDDEDTSERRIGG